MHAEPVVEDVPLARAVSADDADHSGEETDEITTSSTGVADEDEGEGIVRKRRGIRLKQDLN
jgi:hypothetical protein